MANDSLPILPWQTKKKLSQIASEIYNDVAKIQNRLNLSVDNKRDVTSMSERDL